MGQVPSVNLGQVARILAGFALFYSLMQAVPLALALQEEPSEGIDAVSGFLGSMAVGLLSSVLLWIGGRKPEHGFFRKEGLGVVGLAWALAVVLGALPLQWSGSLPNPADAIFESVSGLTTTGASVFGSGGNFKVSQLPASILLWRAMLQWFGGMGVILVFVALLPAMGITGKNLLASEQVGVASEGFQPRMLGQARILLRVYVAMTALCTVLLATMGDMSWFEGVCHSFATVATGGFSTRDGSVGEYDSVAAEVILTVFMFLAGCNFALLASSLRHGPTSRYGLFSNPEFRCYGAITVVVVAIATAALALGGTNPLVALRQASFNVVSVFTSTGFATVDFQRWPQFVLALMIGSMVVGACTGSTAGGIKSFRFLVSMKLVAYTVRHYVRPRSVERVKVGGEPLPASLISGVVALVLVWVLALFLGTALLLLDTRLPFLSALSTSASMLGCCGPAICPIDAGGAVIGPDLGPMGAFGALHGWAKLLCSALMLLGRLEFLLPLALCAPSLWRR